MSETFKTYYVAPSGNDGSPGTESAPFKTIAHARDVVRTVSADMTADIDVLLQEGAYSLDGPIVFGPEDSGRNGHHVRFKGDPHGSTVISGGRRIEGWQEAANGIWKAETDLEFRQLYVNGKPAERAGIPAPDDLEPWGLNGYRTKDEGVLEWAVPTDIEFCYKGMWCHTRCKVASIENTDDGIEIRMLPPYFTLANAREGWNIDYPKQIENSLSFLQAPGQWYLDRAAGALYYKPGPGEDMAATDVIAPVIEKLIDIGGTLDDPVRNLAFEGLTFSHATWLRPNAAGLVDLQANFTLGPESLLFARQGLPMSGCLMTVCTECTKSPANIVCHAAESIRFERCLFENLGGAGIDLEYGSCDNLIADCEFRNIAGSAIQVGDVQREDHHPDDARLVVKNNTVVGNSIHAIATDYNGGVGVFVGYTDGTIIRNNEIFDLPYSGISMGWGWGETDAGGGNYVTPVIFDTPTPAGNNIIEHNHIHHVMGTLIDGGAIYTLGDMPGTVIRENHVHDNGGWPSGIYLDEGSGHIEITGNAIYNVGKAMNYNNMGQDRHLTCSEHDNFFDVTPDDPAFPTEIVARAGRPVPPQSSTDEE